MNRRTLARGAVLTAGGLLLRDAAGAPGAEIAKGRAAVKRRTGRVRVLDHALADAGGPFLGLGVSYFTALRRCKYDRPRLESDLAFLSAQGFNYYRMLSMVGWYGAWEGREIAPVGYVSREGKRVEAWPDYWAQLRDLIDVAYDRYGLRTQVTVFADAQLMPGVAARREHLRRIVEDVLPRREQKIILIEVANEAWQNGFPGEAGVAELREHTQYLAARTRIPIAITSNHEDSFEDVYAGSAADIATWHFSRDRRTDEGWHPVYDSWRLGELPGFPPVSSNEPIGPGASVNTESDPLRLVTAAAFAYAAKLPMYVFHSEAGVFGRSRFEDTPAVGGYRALLRLLPPDLPNWQRNDGKEPRAPFTVFAGGEPNRYRTEGRMPAPDGCIRNIGGRKGNRFVCVPIGIRGGLTLQAREAVRFQAHHPLTGEVLRTVALGAGERVTLPGEPAALLLIGRAG